MADKSNKKLSFITDKTGIKGDFVVDQKYTIEVGGEDKDFRQIKDVPNSYVLTDNLETAIGNKLPIWVVGFLY